jgi:hypothetical protein
MVAIGFVEAQAMETVTVRDIARKIRLPNEDLEVAVARARNWTKENLLRTTGEKHPGTGRERHYPKSAILDAVLLQWLTSVVGMPATLATSALKSKAPEDEASKDLLAGALKDLRQLIDEHPAEDTVIVVSRTIGEKEWSAGVVWLSRLSRWIATRPEDAHVVLNLETLRKHLEP